MSAQTCKPWGQADGKVRPGHRDLAAIIYVRQSARRQLIEHQESTRLQYALVERAAALGWARSRIVELSRLSPRAIKS